ncbi:MAG: 4Fe-4S binding protein [Mycobacterium sp.]|nr:4Fe-4S binding protein [Mycobacterium sp.]
MTYVITTACVDVKHKACAQECPVDCIYEGDRTMYINPDECVECGACKLLCEVDAIYHESELPESERKFLADNAAFFTDVLPGREAPIGAPGGAQDFGPVGVDTPMVSGLPPSQG